MGVVHPSGGTSASEPPWTLFARARWFDGRVRAREDQRFVTVVEADEVRRPALAAAHLDDLADPVDVADSAAVAP